MGLCSPNLVVYCAWCPIFLLNSLQFSGMKFGTWEMENVMDLHLSDYYIFDPEMGEKVYYGPEKQIWALLLILLSCW